MKKLLACGVIAAFLVPTAGTGSAVAHNVKKPRNCSEFALADKVRNLRARGISCTDARVVVRSVESHAQFCRPQRNVAANRKVCDVTPALSVGNRTFHCVAQWANQRFYTVQCTSRVGHHTLVDYIRDGNARG